MPVHTRYLAGLPDAHFPFILHLMVILKNFILLALLSACPALANTITVTGVDNALGMGSLWIHTDQQNNGGSNEQVYWSGAIDINVDGYIRQVFCVQLFTNIYIGNTYNTTMDLADTPNLKRVGWLLQNEFPTTQLDGAAFQLAIWDIIEDDGNGFDTGKVAKSTDLDHPTDPVLLTAIATYERDSAGMSSTYGVVYHNYLGDTPMQNLMGIPITDGGPSPAPEPATVLMIFGGLALIGVSRLRRGARTN